MATGYPATVPGLVVSDNGIGITEKQILKPRSFGVIGMHERVNALGGRLRISVVNREGTTVDVIIPKE